VTAARSAASRTNSPRSVWSEPNPPTSGDEKCGRRPNADILSHAMGSRLPVTSPTTARLSAASERSSGSTPGRMRMPVLASALCELFRRVTPS
jgi:hypothetical protein